MRVQLHGKSVQLAELEGKKSAEMEDKGWDAEIEGEGRRAELPAREVVGVELDGNWKVKRKPVPGERGRVVEEGETLGVWAGIGILAR